MKKFLTIALSALLLGSALTSCGKSDENTIKVAATSTPHAEVLDVCKDAMAAKGYTLEILVVDDYVTPNNATESGDVDANYFQHQLYLDSFNEENGTHLVTVADIHYEPYAIYAGTRTSLSGLQDGDSIAVPNDPTNEARALQLLAAQGLITLKDGAGLTATKNDIVDNPKNLDIKEMEAALLPDQLDEVAMAVINGNYALAAGLDVNAALAIESTDSEAAQTYVNVLVVKEGNENNPSVKALAEVMTSDVVKEYMNATYGNAVVPMF